jgi:hypothetical protein
MVVRFSSNLLPLIYSDESGLMTRVFKPQGCNLGLSSFRAEEMGTRHSLIGTLHGKILPLKIAYRRRSSTRTIHSMGDVTRFSTSPPLDPGHPASKKTHKVLLTFLDLGASPQTPGIF